MADKYPFQVSADYDTGRVDYLATSKECADRFGYGVGTRFTLNDRPHTVTRRADDKDYTLLFLAEDGDGRQV